MPSAGPQKAHQGSVGEGRGSEAALPSLQSKAGQAPVGLGTISHLWHRATEAKAPASLRARDWQQPHSLLSCFCRFCCDQPCFKHVSTDPDSVLCGLTGGLCGRKGTDSSCRGEEGGQGQLRAHLALLGSSDVSEIAASPSERVSPPQPGSPCG